MLLFPEDKFEQALEYLHSNPSSGKFVVIETNGVFGELSVATALLRACDKLVDMHDCRHFEQSFFCHGPLGTFLCLSFGGAAFGKIKASVPKGYLSFTK